MLNELNRYSDREKLGATMSLWKGKGIFTLISISSYLTLMYIYFILMIWHFFLYFVLKLWRELKQTKYLVNKQLIMAEFARCGITMSRCRIE